MSNKLVSVCLITYNHEKFIRNAIEGVLMQKVDFEWELIIADDFSTDGTRAIINEYKQKHPDFIKLILQEKNVGPAKNHIDLITTPKSKYIALCDGDDYWTDPLKLQKQISFLETNPAYVIHSGNAVQISVDPEMNNKPMHNNTTDITFELKDFLPTNNILACTTVFRNVEFELPANFDKIIFGDWFLYVILLKKSGGKVYKSANLFSAYRVHSEGVMGSMDLLKYYESHVIQILAIHKYLNLKLELRVKNVLNYYFLQQYRIVLKKKMYTRSLKLFITNFKYSKTEIPLKKYLSEIKHHIL